MVPMAALAAIRFLKSDSPLGMLKAWLGLGLGLGLLTLTLSLSLT